MDDTVQLAVAGEIRSIIARRRLMHADVAAQLQQPRQWLSRRLAGTVAMTVSDFVAIVQTIEGDPVRVLSDALQVTAARVTS